MGSFRGKLLSAERCRRAAAVTLSLLASLLAAGVVLAQTPPAPDGPPVSQSSTSDKDKDKDTDEPALGAQLQEITVSASAITFSGYDQPTPVTSLSSLQLESAAMPDLTDAVRQLPAFGGSSSPQNAVEADEVSNGEAGLDQLSLRGLGPNRTLLLIDGQRIVDGTIYGGADTNNIPTSLIDRVDVVTGGASAIWGSGAVAGVVNYVLDHNFNGVKIDVQNSNNFQSDHEQYRLDLTAGTPFADDRGHIEAAYSYRAVPDAFFIDQAQGYQTQYLVANPACNLTTGTADPHTGLICPKGQAALIHASNVGLATEMPGGLITNCLNGSGASMPCSLKNIYFTGPNATPMNFNPGNVTNNFLSNGGNASNVLTGDGGLIGAPQKTQTGFMLGSFKFNDHVEATLQLNWGYTSILMDVSPDYGQATIYSGNPFIPGSIQSQMSAQGVSALSVGTTNTNPYSGPVPNIGSLLNAPGMEALFESRRLLRGVVGLDGDFGGGDWTWKVYYERSETHQFENLLNNVYKSALTNAYNAVTVGSYSSNYTAAGYPNPLGLKPGTVTCLSNLLPLGAAGETRNCAPLNIFGTGPGVASPEAVAYINGIARAGGDSDSTDIWEDVGSASVEGKLPFGTSAGPVAMAAGLGWRQEVGVGVNCGINCSDSAFKSGNFPDFYGDYNVREGSIEMNAPLLKDQIVRSLSVDAAYRAVDYSTSGFVSTYKFGVVSQISDAIRFRGSYSQDMRAGNLYELFLNPTAVGQPIQDPRTGATARAFGVTEGNPDVQPEKAETKTAGFVFTPIEGLTASLDWYDIRISDVIRNVPISQVSTLCKAGNASYCEDLIYGSYPGPGSCSGPNLYSCPNSMPLAAVISQTHNADSEQMSGMDFLGDYRLPFGKGVLDFNADANYTFDVRYTQLGVTCDPANGLAPDQSTYAACTGGVPKFKGTFATSYAEGGWLGTIQARFIGETHLVSNWTSGVQVDNNNIPFYTYIDLRLSYRFDNGIQIYSAIDNAGDRRMPLFPFSPYSSADIYQPPYRTDIYDPFGRVWRLGIRAKF